MCCLIEKPGYKASRLLPLDVLRGLVAGHARPAGDELAHEPLEPAPVDDAEGILRGTQRRGAENEAHHHAADSSPARVGVKQTFAPAGTDGTAAFA